MNTRRYCTWILFVWPLWLTLAAFYPADFLQELQDKYTAYTTKYTGVKLQLLFNQPYFAPGDTAFFQAWYLNDASQPIKGEHSVTLELLNTAGKSVQRMRFKVKDGSGYNQLVIPNDLAGGAYKAVGYTDWMRNFGTAWFYQKRMIIVSGKDIQLNGIATAQVAFFPEGGKLVAGLSNKVVVTGPQNLLLSIKDQTGTEVTTVSLDSSGLGTIDITPVPGQQYVGVGTEQAKHWTLPKVDESGIAVRLTNEVRGEFQLAIQENSAWSNKELYALVLSQGAIVLRQAFVAKVSEPFHLTLPENVHGGEVHQLYIFSGAGKVVAERVFRPGGKQPLTMRLNIPAQAMQRERVSASFELLDASGNRRDADFTITVFQRELFGMDSMTRDFSFVELPEVSTWLASGGSPSSINDFLITQRWQKISWDHILTDKTPSLVYPFYSESRFKGSVISRSNGSPAPDSTVVIGYLQNNTIGYEGYTKNGKFDIPLAYDYWGDDAIFCTLQYGSKNVDEAYDIIMAPDSVKLESVGVSVETSTSSRYGQYARNRAVVLHAYSFFGKQQGEKSKPEAGPNSIFEEEFLGADYEVNVQDYLKFPSLADLLQEAVPFVKYRKHGTEESIRMSYRYDKTLKVFKNDPLYIIDGLMTKSTAFFLSLKPDDLLFIKVLNNPNKLTQLGKLGENAVIFVESKKGDLYKFIPSDKLFPIVGLSRPKAFYETSHTETAADRIPDLRSTLYWKPAAGFSKTGRAEFNFFTSDDIGPMKVQIRGLTKEGTTFQYEKEFTVTFSTAK